MASCPFSEKVAVVERRWVGGACPAVACLPSKNELWSIRVAHLVRHSAQFGTLTDVPRAAGMGHHLGSMDTSETWASACNKLIHRVCGLFPRNFIGAGMLPQSPNVSPKNCIAELERCVRDYGFVGVNLNPDPSGGYWTAPPLSDRYWVSNL
ncbi:MAG TPA: amidohydrolase family protein [Chthoniobacterales bacterium]